LPAKGAKKQNTPALQTVLNKKKKRDERGWAGRRQKKANDASRRGHDKGPTKKKRKL